MNEKLKKIVEEKIRHTVDGIEETLVQVVENLNLSLEDLGEAIKNLERSFGLLSQKWSLEILYTLFFREESGFNDLKRILKVNSRTLSSKLKILCRHGYVERSVEYGPPLRVSYKLTEKGRNTVLLALPLLYYLA